MAKSNEQAANFAKETVDNGLKSLAAVSQAAQAIAVETSDYAKRSFEDGVSVWKELTGAKSFESAAEIQANYAKSAYETFVAQATKLGGMYADLGKEIVKPFEGAFAKAK